MIVIFCLTYFIIIFQSERLQPYAVINTYDRTMSKAEAFRLDQKTLALFLKVFPYYE